MDKKRNQKIKKDKEMYRRKMTELQKAIVRRDEKASQTSAWKSVIK